MIGRQEDQIQQALNVNQLEDTINISSLTNVLNELQHDQQLHLSSKDSCSLNQHKDKEAVLDQCQLSRSAELRAKLTENGQPYNWLKRAIGIGLGAAMGVGVAWWLKVRDGKQLCLAGTAGGVSTWTALKLLEEEKKS